MESSRKIKNKLIWQLELSLYFLLEKTNKKFTKAVEENSKEINIFRKSTERYKQIVNIIQRNRQSAITSPLLESYYLEARLGELQATVNSLAQEPLTEVAIANNNEKLKEITESLS